MIGRNINVLQKVSNSIQVSMKRSNSAIVLDDLATLVAVGIWADKKVKEEELTEGESIIEKILDNRNDIAFTEDLITQHLERFHEDSTFFKLKKSELIENIITNANYEFAEYIIAIFKADGVVTIEEKEIVEELSKYLDVKDSLLSLVKQLKHKKV